MPGSPTASQLRRTVVFAWVCLVGGALLTAWAGLNLVQGRASRGWPTAEGTIRSSRVVHRSSPSSTSATPMQRYHPEIAYDYTVDGTLYPGDRVSFRDDHFGKREPAAEIAGRYRPGDAVTVRYNPEDPAQAVLEPVYDWSTYIPLAIGLLFALSGVGLLRVVRRWRLINVPPEPY